MTAAAASASSSSSRASSNSSSGVSGDDSPDSPADDAVYYNKQLIAHLLKKVCSQRDNSGSGSIGNNNNYSHNNNNNRSSSRPQLVGSSSESSRSRSPDESEQHSQHSQQQQQRYLSVSAASSALSASPAYVSPFALSPVSEASPWSHPAISPDVIRDGRTAELERVLICLCDEFELRLHDKFADFSAKLDTEPATIRDSVTHELETLFYDENIHWGRLIAVFVLCREICDKCWEEGRPQLAAAVQQWVAEFIDVNLWDWMRDNQGWFGLVKFYRETGGDRSLGLPFGSGSWAPIASVLTISAVSIAIALAATYFRR